MYLIVVTYVCIVCNVYARRICRDAIIPLERFSIVAPRARPQGIVKGEGIRFNNQQVVTYVHPEAAVAMSLGNWPCDTYLMRQQLYDRCLKRVIASTSLKELINSVQTSLLELKIALDLFFREPVVHLFIHQEVRRFASTFHDLLQNRYHHCMLYDRLRLVDASPRSKRSHALLVETLEDVQRDVVKFLQQLELPVSPVKLRHTDIKPTGDLNYWSRVHYTSYINGVGIALKMIAITMLNRVILPLFLKRLCEALATHIPFVDLSKFPHLLSVNLH